MRHSVCKVPGILLISACLTFASSARADSVWGEFATLDTEPVIDEPEDAFAGRVRFGYLAASGNTETANMNSKLELGWDLEKWRHAVAASSIYSKDEQQTIAENYSVGYKADRKLSEQNYLFGSLSWEQDEFSGYEQRTTQAVGYGRRILESDKHVLDLEAGVGARQSELTDGTEQNESIGRLAGNYLWKFAENSDFSQKMTVESGDLNTYVESVTALTSQLMGTLDLVVSYTIERNSAPPTGLENTDTYTTVSIQYSF